MKAKTPPFAVEDNVLVKHGVEIFDAKILKIDEDSTEPHYFVHYQGWSKKWDEWVSKDRVLDTSDASRQLQKEAKLAAKDAKESGKRKATTSITASGVVKKKTKASNPFDDSVVAKDTARDLEEVVQEIQISIPIPMTLKKILIDDWKNITQQDQWIDLPRSLTVHAIISNYLKDEADKGTDLETMKPILEGLQSYFDKALPLLLLYRQERPQYDQITADTAATTPMSKVYGAEHLLRLFVRLPLLMSQMDLDLPHSDQMRIQNTMTQFLKYLQKQRQTFFIPQYIASTKFLWHGTVAVPEAAAAAK
ncbi:Aste57867_675 [Aphanomyces stellatus]|uniref:Aste57867_675 protein n=1 Tax=Aphanomyces stellatus TaxID=120398 RepID=A0A485K8G2_9STRA|nr:hypothetical protein As57867_000674 [Aphanomyces stellatus]VFT77900.1 Aste57867_675 [Aphanomyces stellatus]